MICELCFHRCNLSEGQTGFCRARACRGGKIVPLNYGKVTSLALDPIEKKPLRRFRPGSKILSVGSFGCNLRCPFCQNHPGTGSLRQRRFPRRYWRTRRWSYGPTATSEWPTPTTSR